MSPFVDGPMDAADCAVETRLTEDLGRFLVSGDLFAFLFFFFCLAFEGERRFPGATVVGLRVQKGRKGGEYGATYSFDYAVLRECLVKRARSMLGWGTYLEGVDETQRP